MQYPGLSGASESVMAQAVDAAYSGIPAPEYANDHIELRQALEKWG